MEFTKNGEIKEIWYKGKLEKFDVYQIPLNQLIYNKHNGRIKSLVKSYESGIGRELNPKDANDKQIIESYLYDSAINRNEKTIKSLFDYGQQEVGIVTKDLVIIDGNRRASLLNKLYRENKNIDYFKAIILPDNLLESKSEIIKLETNYQMGVDNKVEYKPIEKYLRCKELVSEHNTSIEEVAKLMSEKESRINQWLKILDLMEEYLDYLNSPNVYTRLDKKEGHFVDLFNYNKKYESENQDTKELKNVYFDYIRLGIPVARARIIGNPRNSMSLFSKKEYWKDFYDNHIEIKEKFKEDSFKELKLKFPEKSNEQIFNRLDSDFKDNIGSNLLENLISGEIYIKQLSERKNTLNKLKNFSGYLNHFDITENILSDKEKIVTLLDEIIENATCLKSKLND
ncbi:hypothetical protein [Mesoflavibacter zeaxanthinifaciens]|uniref:hypothetical protein n=1 Tax=Mesoflavibacter zeaxanthinifaciens TaxID=393060 RepID=UPI003A94F3C1